MPSRRLEPDTALQIRLDAIAGRYGREATVAAVAELQALAGGRADLLALAAGSHLGRFLGHAGRCHPATIYSAGLLLLAGGDPDRAVEHADAVRRLIQSRDP